MSRFLVRAEGPEARGGRAPVWLSGPDQSPACRPPHSAFQAVMSRAPGDISAISPAAGAVNALQRPSAGAAHAVLSLLAGTPGGDLSTARTDAQRRNCAGYARSRQMRVVKGVARACGDASVVCLTFAAPSRPVRHGSAAGGPRWKAMKRREPETPAGDRHETRSTRRKPAGAIDARDEASTPPPQPLPEALWTPPVLGAHLEPERVVRTTQGQPCWSGQQSGALTGPRSSPHGCRRS